MQSKVTSRLGGKTPLTINLTQKVLQVLIRVLLASTFELHIVASHDSLESMRRQALLPLRRVAINLHWRIQRHCHGLFHLLNLLRHVVNFR